MHLIVNERIRLTEINSEDKPALVECLNDPDIFENTLRIPSPYTEADAEAWLNIVRKSTKQQGQPVQWAIRTENDALIGGCGFDGLQLGKSHQAEIAYWLARSHWGQGIMSAAAAVVCRHAFEEFGLVKIIAHVFDFNIGSARVLEKCGFEQEGLLRNHFLKQGKLINARRYGLFKPT
ncbi:MAG: GNAT family N-acetyltransferase [Planctomycetales bacterium]